MENEWVGEMLGFQARRGLTYRVSWAYWHTRALAVPVFKGLGSACPTSTNTPSAGQFDPRSVHHMYSYRRPHEVRPPQYLTI